MRHRIQNISVVIVILVIFSFSLVKVYAENTGIDLITLTKNKIISMVNSNTVKIGTDLQNSEVQTENDILAYVDGYIKGIDTELSNYTKQQENQAINNLNATGNDIKTQLEALRPGLITDAEKQIQSSIDTEYQKQQTILVNDLNKKLTEKFK